MTDTGNLLVEIGTEELPPESLRKLAVAFADEVKTGIEQKHLAFAEMKWYATPRRLALSIKNLTVVQPDWNNQRRGPALKAAFDENGRPTEAAIGFARSCSIDVEQLDSIETDEGGRLVYRTIEKGQSATALVPGIIETALHRLPVARRMRWGNGKAEFARPIRWIVLLFDDAVIECEIFNLPAGNITYGHRFHCRQAIELKSADDYPEQLLEPGCVRADFDERREYIAAEIKSLAGPENNEVLIDPDLLEEVTALTEWPTAIKGRFDERFLDLPREVLISVMQEQQKCFPVGDGNGLRPEFVAVINVRPANPEKIIQGNERVIHPRLSDAKFFWDRDCATPLSSRIDALKQVVYEQRLGSLYDKSQRIKTVAVKLAEVLKSDKKQAARAADLAKCDLLTDMVGEFPKLQGVMGRYYAGYANEPDEVATAIDEQYLPRFASDRLPQTRTGQIIAVAEKIDALSGIFAIGRAPTGDKDPFGLRRSALGLLRILIECRLDIDLPVLINWSAASYHQEVNAKEIMDDLLQFITGRLRQYCLDKGIGSDVFESVLALNPNKPLDFYRRLLAVNQFRLLPEADSLSVANKRIANILKQAALNKDVQIDESMLREPAELSLAKNINEYRARVAPMLDKADYKNALAELAGLGGSVDLFFDNVMVMCEDSRLKNNRLALLQDLNRLFLKIADISCLRN